MNIHYKMFIPNVCLLALVTTGLAYTVIQSKTEQQSILKITEKVERINCLSRNLTAQQHNKEKKLLSYYFNTDREYLNEIPILDTAIGRIIVDLKQLNFSAGGNKLIEDFIKNRAGISNIQHELLESIQYKNQAQVKSIFLRWSIKSKQIESSLTDLVVFNTKYLERVIKNIEKKGKILAS